MSTLTEFDRWFEKEYPTLYRAATGIGSWGAADREHASKMRRHMLGAWAASRAAALKDAAEIADMARSKFSASGFMEQAAGAWAACESIRDVAKSED